MQPLGLYLHTPFCAKKCAYCSFYSLPAGPAVYRAYTKAVIQQLTRWGSLLGRPADTLYLGGGTPTLLGAKALTAILVAAKKAFLLHEAEITLEANPAENLGPLFRAVAKNGVNRISLGVQSAVESELCLLGRRHRFAEVKKAVQALKNAGIQNFSLDLMLGIPGQTPQSLAYTLNELLQLQPTHLSAYMLSVEPDTPLYQNKAALNLPGPDETAAFYLQTCSTLEQAGFKRYEISNFAKKGFESRHNNKYWQGAEYLGIGPSAHSFLNGKRFYYPASLQAFLNGAKPVDDGSGGGYEEYLMLALRLTAGLNLARLEQLYGSPLPGSFYRLLTRLKQQGYALLQNGCVSLTNTGALVSNSIITALAECL